MPESRTATLVAVAPLPAQTYALTRSPFSIGRGRNAAGRVDHPLVQPEHLVLLSRADGWWLAAGLASVSVNGQPTNGRDRRLANGDRIELAAGATLRFDDGQQVASSPADRRPAPVVPSPRRRQRWRMPEINISGRGVLIGGIVVLALGLIGGFSWVAWRSYQERPVVQEAPLTLQEAGVFDSLVAEAFDHIERGNVLLELGARQAALDEFGAGIATISASSLRKNAYVLQRLDQLRSSIGEVYRSRRLTVPKSLASISGGRALNGEGLKAVLSVSQFSSALSALRAEFRARFGSTLEITGADHAEHLSLYGAGGAVDLRSRTLTPDQLQFVVSAAQRTGVRVKDFSQDAVLRAQIAAATRAGLADRASTGLHLHLDRFANRRDRWTVP